MVSAEKKKLIVILGPTASGKTTLAVKLASEFKGEIISADSRQVYRGMDLGTGKDLSEYELNGCSIPYHLIDIIDPSEEFNLFQFQRRFLACFNDLIDKGKLPVLVGGTGMYLESIILNYKLLEAPVDEELRRKLSKLNMEDLIEFYRSSNAIPHNKTDLTDRNRLIRAIEIGRQANTIHEGPAQTALHLVIPFVIGVRWERSVLRQRITARLRARLDAGMINEVKRLNEKGISWERIDAFGLEYRYIASYLIGHLTYDEMFKTLETKIHQFAKRQDTWFRRMERRGVDIHWVNGTDYEAVRRMVQMALTL